MHGHRNLKLVAKTFSCAISRHLRTNVLICFESICVCTILGHNFCNVLKPTFLFTSILKCNYTFFFLGALIVSDYRSHLKIPCTRKVTCSTFLTQDPQILGTTRKIHSPDDLLPGICAPLHYVYDGFILHVYQQGSKCKNTEGEGIILQIKKCVAIQITMKRH